jgi:cytochrome c oxidase subunit 3
MWTFLVTEVMFFGGLFLCYILYRWQYQPSFFLAHEYCDRKWGAINTTVLLTSSLSMVLAVHFAQLKNKKMVLANLAFTIVCAFVFLGVKSIEYYDKYTEHLVPGVNFHFEKGGNPNAAQIFFSLYFAMTGLHAIHIIIGILVLTALGIMHFKEMPIVRDDFVPTEMVGLYWHFVDLVWIFLFPLFYLIPQ